ncbi:MAG: pantoate--beta-alanine ligase [Planctomycetes bacterium]|nr:pantoate--beta-alanine ligase [Planctomycetota bacterium]
MTRVVESVAELAALRSVWLAQGLRVGFVPTMGALHAGHASLVRRARAENDICVVSVYVNPLQFGPREDLARYPRDLAGDVKLCESVGADVLFAPRDDEMYPAGFQTVVDQLHLPRLLEGKARPTHFRGVLTVVLKLFNLVRAHRAYFGQKDYQQTVVLRRMALDLHVGTEVLVLPTVREEDGLALSSRNRYLSVKERKDALCLSQALVAGEALIRSGERRGSAVTHVMRARIERVKKAAIDYVACVDPETLRPLKQVGATSVLLVAVRLGKTRLIDNSLVML